jgi:uncharacterized protein (TIGR02284 family)
VASDLVDQLKSLHTRANDALHGYGEAMEQAEGHGMTPLFKDMIAIHTRNSDELAMDLRGMGERASDDGSFMSTVHRTIMDVRSFFGGLGQSVLPGLIDGEKRNVDSYNEVLKTLDLPVRLRERLVQQRVRLESSVSDMEATKR